MVWCEIIWGHDQSRFFELVLLMTFLLPLAAARGHACQHFLVIMLRHEGKLTDKLDLQVDAQNVLLLHLGRLLEIPGVLGLVLDALGLEALQGVREDDPGADAGPEVLGRERAERDVLPGLDVASAPVVEQDIAKDVILGLSDGDGLAQLVRAADEHAHLELEVELLRGGEGGNLGLGLGVEKDLAPGAADGCAGDHDARGAAVVGNGEMRVVGLQGVVGTAEQNADVEGVVLADVEVGVVANGHGDVVLHVREAEQGLLAERRILLQELGQLRVGGEDLLKVGPHLAMKGASEGGKCVEGLLREDIAQGVVDLLVAREALLLCEHLQIKHMLTNGNSRARCRVGGRRDDAERDVGGGKVARRSNIEPGRHLEGITTTTNLRNETQVATATGHLEQRNAHG